MEASDQIPSADTAGTESVTSSETKPNDVAIEQEQETNVCLIIIYIIIG